MEREGSTSLLGVLTEVLVKSDLKFRDEFEGRLEQLVVVTVNSKMSSLPSACWR